jgi:uncharacterized protein YndB with AHSA1/START domain
VRTHPRTIVAAALLIAAASRPARAEIKQATPDTMQLAYQAELRASPSTVYAALGRISEWWSGEHTYSGDARNLTLEVGAGGCFCERWSGGSVEHGRVVLAQTNDTVRLAAALGPLQESAVSAVMTFKVAAAGGGTQLTVTYRVGGNATHSLDKLAPIVDQVLGQQIARLARLVDGQTPK